MIAYQDEKLKLHLKISDVKIALCKLHFINMDWDLSKASVEEAFQL